jgi:hypothetical protein
MLDNAIAYMAKADLDTIPAESTSTSDEMTVDATAKPADLSFEEDARRRLVSLLAHEKNTGQRRVAGIVDEK